jgi:hypothetical protein
MMKQKNKITVLIMLLVAASMLVQSCGKDNLEYPSSTLSGRFTYQGQPVKLLHTSPDLFVANNNTVGHLRLQQVKGEQPIYGVGLIDVYARHDGSFSAKFFDGEYNMSTGGTNKNPFEDFTTPKLIAVNGNTDLGNIEVVPYWWMNNLQTTYTGGVFTATFNLTKPSAIAARTLQYVAIYLSPTNFPDIVSATQGAVSTFDPTKTFRAGTPAGVVIPAPASNGGPVTVKFDLNTLSTGEKQFLRAFGNNGSIYASIGVKTTGVNDQLYSDAIQLQLP